MVLRFFIVKWRVAGANLLWAILCLIPLTFLTSCLGWGDTLEGRKHVIGNYWLLEDETGSYELFYEEGGDYVGRSPRFSAVIEYGIDDSLLILKLVSTDSMFTIMGINMKADSKYADNFLIDGHKATEVYRRLKRDGLRQVE